MDDDLGLTDREKELKKWNGPYIRREFPKMLFRGTTTTAGRVEYVTRTVGSAVEEREAQEAGWLEHPQTAIDAETTRQAAAQADGAALEATTAAPLPEIPAGRKLKTPARVE